MNLPAHGYTFTIPLTQGKQALVDERDWYELRKFKWHALWNPGTRSFYAVRNVRLPNGKRGLESMARRILALKYGDPLKADHWNHDTLDNRRKNLRVVTHRQNHENRLDQSPHGVGTEKGPRGRFYARLNYNGSRHYLGAFDTPEEARAARAAFLKEHNLG